MSIAKSIVESQAGNVDGTRRSLSEAWFPNLLSPSDFPKLELNPNPRRRGSEASNRNLLSPSDFISEDFSDYPTPKLLSIYDFLSVDVSDYPNPNPISLSDLLSEYNPNLNLSDLPSEDDLYDYPDLTLISLSDLLSEDLFEYPNPKLLSIYDFRKPSPKPRPYYRGWGKLSRKSWGKLSPKQKEDWCKRIKKEAEENKYKTAEEIKDHKKAQELLFHQMFFPDASVTPNTTKEELTTTKEELLAPPTSQENPWQSMLASSQAEWIAELQSKGNKCEVTTTKEELLAPPTSEEDPWQSMLGCSEAEWIAELQSKGINCKICGGINHYTRACSYLVEIPPDAKIVNERIFQIACAYCSMPLVDGACRSQCLPPTRRKVIKKSLDFGWRSGGLPKKKLFAKDLPKKELFAPPSSEMVVHSSSEETTTPCV